MKFVIEADHSFRTGALEKNADWSEWLIVSPWKVKPTLDRIDLAFENFMREHLGDWHSCLQPRFEFCRYVVFGIGNDAKVATSVIKLCADVATGRPLEPGQLS